MSEDKLNITPEMLRQAKDNEKHQRAATGGEASEDTQKVLDAQELEKETQKYVIPEHPDEKSKKENSERAQDAIKKLRKWFQEEEPQRPNYDKPPKD